MSESQLRKSLETFEANELNFVTSTEAMQYKDGALVVNGCLQIPLYVQAWESSKPDCVYRAVVWEDPISKQLRATCDCMGFTHRYKCRHATEMMTGEICGRKKHGEIIRINTVLDAMKHLPGITVEAANSLNL